MTRISHLPLNDMFPTAHYLPVSYDIAVVAVHGTTAFYSLPIMVDCGHDAELSSCTSRAAWWGGRNDGTRLSTMARLTYKYSSLNLATAQGNA